MRVGRRRKEGDDERAGSALPPTPPGVPSVDGYSDLEVIGHGGSATVYRASQDDFGRRVALKVLNIDVSNRRAQRRFTSERELNGRLSDHPNVVTVLDSGFVDGRYPYLAMEHFEYGSLADRLDERGPLPVELVLHIGVRIAGSLESAHRIGVLHRDVKPQNILMSRYGEPALADFGIATMLELEHSLTHALTPVHAAPEVLEGHDPSPAADIYALGSSLYTLLAGTPPFAGPPGEGMLAQLLRITTSELPALMRDDVPDSLVAALRTATDKRPDGRFTTAAAFGEALRAIQSELGYDVTPLPIGDRELDDAPTQPASTHDRGDAAPAPWGSPAPNVAPGTVGPTPPPARDWFAEAPHSPAAVPADGPDVSAAVPDATRPPRDDVTVGQQLDSRTIAARQLHPGRDVAPERRRRWPIVVSAIAALVVIGGVVVLIDRVRDDGGAETAPTVTTVEATDTTEAIDVTTDGSGGSTPAGAPTGVTATFDPTSGGWLLDWRAPGGGARPVVFVRYPGGEVITEVPAPGSTSHVIEADMGPDDPVCFEVAAVELGGDASSPETIRGEPVCVNGAMIRDAP